MYQKWIKRFLDIILSLAALAMLWPMFALISVLIKCDSPGPVFFRQKRVGIGKKHFDILKFRTMCTDTPAEIPTHLLKNPDAYITRSGRFLRRTSLDELPQLINILRGEMSIVGPRPALWNQLDLLEARDRCGANDVLPGLTGWAQVNGRDELEIDDKARYDGEYVRHLSLGMDMKCIMKTFAVVGSGKGIAEGETAEKVQEIHQEKDGEQKVS